MTMKVKTRFTADENVSSIARRIDENVRRMNRNVKRGFHESSKSALNFREVTKSIISASIVQKGFGLLANGVSTLATQFGDFDKTTREAATRFIDIGAKSENFSEKLKELRKSARDAGASSLFTAPQAAKVLDIFARAGFDSATAMKSLKNQIDFAVATGEDFVFSTTAATKLLGAYGLATGDAAQKSKNLGRVNDVLAKLVNTSNVNLENVFDTMKLVGKVSTSLGSDLEEVSAFTAVLGNSALDGSIAMTALRNLFLRTAAPTKESAQLMKALGLSLDDGTGKTKKMTTFITELRDKISGFSDIKQAAILEQLYGKQAITGVQTLMGEIPAIKEFEKSFRNAGGEVSAASEKIGEALPNKLMTLESAITEFGFKVLEPFEKGAKGAIDSLTELFRTDPKALTDGLKRLIELTGKFIEIISKTEAFEELKELFVVLKDTISELLGLFSDITGFSFDTLSENIGVLDLALAPLKSTIEILTAGLKVIKSLLTIFRGGDEAKKLIRTKRGEILARGGLMGMTRTIFGADEERENREQEERRKLLMPSVNMNPDLNVNVTNKITAKNIEVDTTVSAPGTLGMAGANIF